MDGVQYAIGAKDVYVRYPVRGGGTKLVLNDVDLRVRPGEFVTIVGPSGCGKSTLLKLILGSEQPTGGTVLIDGEVAEGVDRNRGIVFQGYLLFKHLTVLENIMFGLELEQCGALRRRIGRILKTKRYRRFREEALMYLDRIGFTLADGAKYPRQLSGGMQQRVAIAQALIMKPKVLLMDEPFGALDDDTRRKMQLFALEQWEKSGTTIFFVTHSIEEALFVGSRLIALSQFYSSDKDRDAKVHGAKIVLDVAVPAAKSTSDDLKYKPEFTELMRRVRHDALDPENLQHIGTFELSHPDSFRTVRKEEWQEGGVS
jgi:NitT/TauT family transport system ATP-binding protein